MPQSDERRGITKEFGGFLLWLGLGNIQFVKDGDRLSGRASADADFDALEDDEDVLGGDAGEELPDYLR